MKRPFTCERCGHRMRFFGSRCNNCMLERPFRQRGSSFLLGGLLLLVAVYLLIF